MINGDYSVVEKNGAKYVIVKDKYFIGENIGEGGFGEVYKAFDKELKREVAFKILKLSNRKAVKMIEDNLKEVKRCQNKDGGRIGNTDNLVQIYDIFRLPQSDQLAYTMELADLNNMFSLKNYHDGKVSFDAEEKCKIVKSIALFFKGLHRAGFFYKDINEGNLFFSKNGKLVVIDADNIAYGKEGVVVGTHGYIAPEVYMGEAPSDKTDRFSMAVFLYRLMIGNHIPYEGNFTESFYMNNDDADPRELFPITRGKDAVFAFDPNNRTNTIRGMKISYNTTKQKIYEDCVEAWDSMPAIVQNAFIQTFVDGKTNPLKRLKDADWVDLFDYLMSDGLVNCPECGKKNINGGPGSIKCCVCGKKYNINTRLNKETVDSLTFDSKAISTSTYKTTKVKSLTLRLLYKNGLGKTVKETKTFEYVEGRVTSGRQVCDLYDDSVFFQLMYSSKGNMLALKNLSGKTWKYRKKKGDEYIECAANGMCKITDHMQIVVEDKLYIEVDGISL